MKPTLLLLSALFCFHLSDAQQYRYHSKINPDTSIFNGFFGHDLEILGDQLFVSYAQSPIKNQNGTYAYQAGKVEIFSRQNNHWNYRDKVIPVQPDSIRLFGLYMEVEDTTLAVLAYNLHGQESLKEDSACELELQIFNLRDGQWIHKQSLGVTPYSKSAVHSLALHRNTIVVGSGHETINDKENAGKMYVFEFDTSWDLSQVISNPNPSSNDFFGNAVDIDNEFIVVAAFGRKVDDKTSAGTVYTYKNSSGTWNYHKTLLPRNKAHNAFFGTTVQIEGNTIAIGAFKEKLDQNQEYSLSDAGAVYIFNLENNFWVQNQKIVPKTRSESAFFGYSLSIQNNRIAISAYNEKIRDSNDIFRNAGAVYLFEKQNSKWQEKQKVYSPVVYADLYIGRSLGLSDSFLAVGAPYDRTDSTWNYLGQTRSGSVLLFYLTPGTLSISELNDHNFSVYPNPSNGTIQFENSLNEAIQYEIYSSNGQRLCTGTLLKDEQTTINLPEEKGIYMLHIQAGNKRMTKKLVRI